MTVAVARDNQWMAFAAHCVLAQQDNVLLIKGRHTKPNSHYTEML